uniref:Uncharacterized protein n=1 Tax=Daphnia magna TaxID=35525 RepID=A0A0P5TU76_9CRUS
MGFYSNFLNIFKGPPFRPYCRQGVRVGLYFELSAVSMAAREPWPSISSNTTDE